MNARNFEYVRFDPSAFRVLDSKLLTKKVLQENNIPIATTLAVFTSRRDVNEFNWESLPPSFVVKPNQGFGGQGIVISFGRSKKSKKLAWIGSEGRLIQIDDLRSHIFNILDGTYSLSSLPDIAFLEERMKTHPDLKPYSYKGIPDIRIIVYNGIPVMAMLRLPTKESKGKANLHQGGIGVGIDISSGLTTSAVLHGNVIDYLPGTKLLLRSIPVPFWDKIVSIAVKSAHVVGLNYVGVDIAIDRDKGPIVLEINARPGLAIQLANLTPLRARLWRIKGLDVKTSKRGIEIAKSMFGGETEESEEPSKKVIGIFEQVDLPVKNNGKVTVMAKIDTGAKRTAMSQDLFDKIGLGEEDFIENRVYKSALGQQVRPVYRYEFSLAGEKIKTEVTIAPREGLMYPIIIGRDDLAAFLIDPTKHAKRSEVSK